MRADILFVFALVATPTCLCRGQELLFVGSRLDATWTGGEALFVQSGYRVHRFVPSTSGVPTGEVDPWVLESGTVFFDRGSEDLLISERQASGSALGAVPWDVPAPLLQSPKITEPLRLPLLFGDGGALVPARPTFLLQHAGTRARSPLSVPDEGLLELGWGIGDPLEVTYRTPHVIPRRRADGRIDVLVGEGASFRLHDPDGGSRALAPPPFDDEPGILEFPWDVPPLVGDLDGRKGEEILLVDPSSGTIAIYDDPDQPHPEPGRILLVNGLVLAAWIGPFASDDSRDLCVLRAPLPGLTGQIRVVQKGLLAAEVLLWRGEGGVFPRSPTHRLRLDLPLDIGIRNEVRTARFPSLFLPLPDARVLLASPTGDLRVRSLTDADDDRPLGSLPPGRSLAPFDLIPFNGGYAFGWESGSGGRVFFVRP
jgi:hypothetical protein